MEAVVAVMVLATVLLAYFGLSQTTVRSVGQSRNYLLATVAAQNAIEEIRAHRFGTPLIEKNLTFEPTMILDGRAAKTAFHVRVEPDREAGGNGSLMGDDLKDFDVLKVAVTWEETEPSGVGTREQSLDFQLVVRRPYEL